MQVRLLQVRLLQLRLQLQAQHQVPAARPAPLRPPLLTCLSLSGWLRLTLQLVQSAALFLRHLLPPVLVVPLLVLVLRLRKAMRRARYARWWSGCGHGCWVQAQAQAPLPLPVLQLLPVHLPMVLQPPAQA